MKRSSSFSKTFLIGYAVIAALVVVASIVTAISRRQISASSDQLVGYTDSTCQPSTNLLDTGIQYQSWYKEVAPTTNLEGITKAYSVVKLINNQYVETTITINVKNITGNYKDRFYPGDGINVNVSSTINQSDITGMAAIALMDPGTRDIIPLFGPVKYQSVKVATTPWKGEFVIPANWKKGILVDFAFYGGTTSQDIANWKCAVVFDAFTFKTDGTAPSQTATPTATTTATATATGTPSILPGQCIDSDNGKNYFTKGIASFASASGGIQSVEDKCDASGKVLTEYFCTPFSSTLNVTQSVNYTCPNGCSNGACVGNSTSSPELLSITTYKIIGSVAQTTVAEPPMPSLSVTSTVANPPVPPAPTTPTTIAKKTAPPVIQITPTPTATPAAAQFIVSGIKSGTAFYVIVIAVVLIGSVIIFRIVTAKE